MTTDDEPAAHEEFEALFSDYFDGTLAPDEQARIRAHLQDCAGCRAGYQAHQELMAAFEGARRRAPAPAQFAETVEATIHRRSAGRFFGRRTLGDRVPFGALLAVAMVVLVAVAALLWSSSTGSLRYRREAPREEPRPGAADGLRPP